MQSQKKENGLISKGIPQIILTSKIQRLQGCMVVGFGCIKKAIQKLKGQIYLNLQHDLAEAVRKNIFTLEKKTFKKNIRDCYWY